MRRRRRLRFVAIFALVYLAIPMSAHAYLDPGTGSYILQILLASLFGALFALKLFWKKIVAFFKNLSVKKSKDARD